MPEVLNYFYVIKKIKQIQERKHHKSIEVKEIQKLKIPWFIKAISNPEKMAKIIHLIKKLASRKLIVKKSNDDDHHHQTLIHTKTNEQYSSLAKQRIPSRENLSKK